MKNLTSHLQYCWWRYVVIAVVIILVWSFLFAQLAKVEDNRKVKIEFFSALLDADRLNADFAMNMERISTQDIKEIRVSALHYSGAVLYELITTRIISSDILIFTEDMLIGAEGKTPAVAVPSFFPELPITEFEQLLKTRAVSMDAAVEYFCVDGKPYGIYLDQPDGSRFQRFYDGSQRCVAFFSERSVNLSALYGQGEASDGAAIDVLIYLLESQNR